MVRESAVRHNMLTKITVAAGLLGLLAVFGGTPAAMAAPLTAESAHGATTVARAAPRAGHATCVPVRSPKRHRLEHCSVAIALPAASAASAPTSPQAVAHALAVLRATLPANATDMTAGVSGGCVENAKDQQSCEYNLDPGPRQACGGFNGHIEWTNDNYGLDAMFTWGEVWSLCAATAYVYLSWQQSAGLCGENKDAGSASAYSTSGVNYEWDSENVCIGGPSDVQETVCTTEDGGWHCGTGVHV
jgi:hypothetical protein